MPKNTKTEEDEKRNQVRDDYAKMQREVVELREKRDTIQMLFDDPTIGKILGHYETEIESFKEHLITADKKDIDRLQAEVRARRSLIATLKGAYEHDLEEADRRMREFKEKHALYLLDSEAKPEVATKVS